jgi:AbiV family abortive infection protein
MDIVTRLETFKIAAYRNAVRLFRDAALLFNNERYPSSFALAVYSFEELGKMQVIDRGCDMLCMNPHGAEEIYKFYFEGSLLKDHRHKQVYALWDALGVMPDKNDRIWSWVDTGRLERNKQDAPYVEMGHKEIKIPASITREKALGCWK